MTKESEIRTGRRRVMALHLPATVAEYPFECCIAAWGLFAGVATLIPGVPTPSITLDDLPNIVEHAWGLAMFIGAITMTTALIPRIPRLALLGRGMALCAVTLGAFGVAVIGTIGWSRLLTGILLILVGGAAGVRASKLRADYYTALQELTVEHHNNGGNHQPKEG